MNITRAKPEHVEEVAELFDWYRQFYEQPTDIALARRYIEERIDKNQSVIFLAKIDDRAVGFVQLYPSFCSVEAAKIMILYDLFVAGDARREGVGEALMNQAKKYAQESGASRLDLLTAKTNAPGQALYEKLGYARTNKDFFAYSLPV